MIACFDVHYTASGARAAAVVADAWMAEVPLAEYVVSCPVSEDYEPGKFYLRELPPLLALTSQLAESVRTLVIDGYCHLSADAAPGLGARLAAALPAGMVIAGVAKSRYQDSTHAVEVVRGGSHRPLFVTSIGISYQAAAGLVASMAGEFRMPTLLKAVDRLSRGHVPARNVNPQG